MTPQIKKRIAQIQKGEVPAGYKMTDVGIVPQEWATISLGELFDFFGGLGIARDKLGSQGIPYLHYGDMHRHSFTKVGYEKYMLLPKYDTKIRGDENFLLHDGDIVFLDASEDLEGTSRSVVVDNVENKPFISGLHTFIARSKSTLLSKGYKQYCTSSQVVKRQFEKKAVGFKVYGVNRNSIKGIEIAYPTSKTEQNRIAEILLTQDKHIELQEKLIAQKQEQKKYLMQMLLTGKQRLKGFSGEWEKKALAKVTIKIGSGKTPLGGEAVYQLTGIPLIRSQNIQQGTFSYEGLAFIDQETHQSMSSSMTQKNDVLLNITGASIGRCCVLPEKISDANVNQHVCIIRLKNQNAYYIAELLNSKWGQSLIDSFQCGGGRQGLNFQQLGSFAFILPPLPEQEAIAEILSAADKEIELLQKQLEHEKQRKKSLMQLLLTGIVRV